MGRKRHSIDVLFMFVLFAVFAILSVLIIFIGSGVYNKISDNKTLNEQTRTTLSYMVNKVRASGLGENIYIKDMDGTEVLTVKNNADGISIETLIYEHNGKLMEMTVAEGDSFELQFGDALIDIGKVEFDIDKEKNLLSIEVTNEQGEGSSVSLYLGSI